MNDPTRDTEPTPHPLGDPDVPLEDEYVQHAREERYRRQRERMDEAREKAKAEREAKHG